VLVPRNKYVLGSESTSSERIYATILLYISVCLRTRRDTISYSSDIYSSETGPGNFRIQNSGNWNSESRSSEFRKLDRETSEFRNFRIQNSGNWNSESRSSELRKLDRETSEFRNFRIQNRETGSGNFRIQNSGN